MLLKHKASVNIQTHSGGVTALQRASYKGDVPVVQLLLRYDADVKLSDSDGLNSLHKVKIIYDHFWNIVSSFKYGQYG